MAILLCSYTFYSVSYILQAQSLLSNQLNRLLFQNLNKNPDYAAMFRSRPLRFVLPVNCDNPTNDDVKNDQLYVSPEKLCDLGCETPRINEFKIGKKYRFFYAISSDVDAENPGTVIIVVLWLNWL